MKLMLLAVAAASLAACSGPPNRPLPMVKKDAPVVRLNADRWQATVNDLTQPPGDGAPHPTPAPVLLHYQRPAL